MFHPLPADTSWTLDDWNAWSEYARHPLLTQPGRHSDLAYRINAYLNWWEKRAPELGIRNKMFDETAYLEDIDLEHEIAKMGPV